MISTTRYAAFSYVLRRDDNIKNRNGIRPDAVSVFNIILI